MDRVKFLVAATVSAKYHQRRHAFLWMVDTFLNLVIVISAASAFGFLLGGEQRSLAKVATATITLLGLCQIILGIGKSAYAHQMWYKKWRELLADVESELNPSADQLKRWNQERTAIEVECIGELRALEVDCRNKAITALDYDEDEIRKIKWWQRAIIQLGTLQSDFPKLS